MTYPYFSTAVWLLVTVRPVVNCSIIDPSKVYWVTVNELDYYREAGFRTLVTNTVAEDDNDADWRFLLILVERLTFNYCSEIAVQERLYSKMAEIPIHLVALEK